MVAQEAAARWLNWPLSLAFTTWRANTAEAQQERHNEYRALKFLYYALTLKALTGFRWAVQEAQVHSAADEHREGAMKRAVIRSWRVAAEHLKVSLGSLAETSVHTVRQRPTILRSATSYHLVPITLGQLPLLIHAVPQVQVKLMLNG